MIETNTTWDTGEASLIIANDEGLYNIAMRLERTAHSTGQLAQLMEDELRDIISTYPYSEVDMQKVDWREIASEYTEE